jgi:probable HAF family extracellular repeat protein
MSKRLLRKLLVSLVGAVVIAVGITLFTTTQATTTFFYTVTELGNIGGNDSLAYDINDSGQVVGYASVNPGPGVTHAVLWNNDGTLIDLRKSGAIPYNWASAINNAGQVVCNIDLAGHFSGRVPYLWQNGNITNSIEGNGNSFATGINNAGQVAGWEFFRFPFVWQKGAINYLKTLTGSTSDSRALGINDKEQVIGYSSTSDNKQHAVLWQNNRIIDLGTLSGGNNSQALGINNRGGKVVGWSDTSSGSKHAVLWQKRRITDLGTLGGNATTATAINNRGIMVGYSFTVNNDKEIPLHAFVWRNSSLIDLNSLLPANSSWELTTANAINEWGQIVGSGKKDGQTKAFLLTPTVVSN